VGTEPVHVPGRISSTGSRRTGLVPTGFANPGRARVDLVAVRPVPAPASWAAAGGGWPRAGGHTEGGGAAEVEGGGEVGEATVGGRVGCGKGRESQDCGMRT
jgi:hypothetical protein